MIYTIDKKCAWNYNCTAHIIPLTHKLSALTNSLAQKLLRSLGFYGFSAEQNWKRFYINPNLNPNHNPDAIHNPKQSYSCLSPVTWPKQFFAHNSPRKHI